MTQALKKLKHDRRYLGLLEAQEALGLNSAREKRLLQKLRMLFSVIQLQPKPKQKE